MTYPLTREQTIAQLSEFKENRPADIQYGILLAYIHYASEEYDRAFHNDNAHDQAWWDGALAMARWIVESEEN